MRYRIIFTFLLFLISAGLFSSELSWSNQAVENKQVQSVPVPRVIRTPDYIFSDLVIDCKHDQKALEVTVTGELRIITKGFVKVPLALKGNALHKHNFRKDTPVFFRNGFLYAAFKGKKDYDISYSYRITGLPVKDTADERYDIFLPLHQKGATSVTLDSELELQTDQPIISEENGKGAHWKILTSGEMLNTILIRKKKVEKTVRFSAEEKAELSISDENQYAIKRKTLLRITAYDNKLESIRLAIPEEFSLKEIKYGFKGEDILQGNTLTLLPARPVGGNIIVSLTGTHTVRNQAVDFRPVEVEGALFQKGAISIRNRHNISISETVRESVARSSSQTADIAVFFYSAPEALLRLAVSPNPVRHVWRVYSDVSYTPEAFSGFSACTLSCDGGKTSTVYLKARGGAQCSSIQGRDVRSWVNEGDDLIIHLAREVDQAKFRIDFTAPSRRSGSAVVPGFVSPGDSFTESLSLRTATGYVLTPVRMNEFKTGSISENINKIQQKQTARVPGMMFMSERSGSVSVRIEKRRSLFKGNVVYRYNVMTDTVSLAIDVQGTVSQKHAESVEFSIPAGYILDSVSGRNVASWTESGSICRVAFASPVLGAFGFTCSLLKPITDDPVLDFRRNDFSGFDRISTRIEVTMVPFFEIADTSNTGMNVQSTVGNMLVYTGNKGQMSFRCTLKKAPLKFETYTKSFLFIRRGKVEIETDLLLTVPSKPAERVEVVFSQPVTGYVDFKGDDVASFEELKKGLVYVIDFREPVQGFTQVSIVRSLAPGENDMYDYSLPFISNAYDRGGITALIKGNDNLEVLDVTPKRMSPVQLGDESEGLVSAFLFEQTSKAQLAFKAIIHRTKETTPVTCSALSCLSYPVSSGNVNIVRAQLFNKSAQNIAFSFQGDEKLTGTYINGRPVRPLQEQDRILIPAGLYKGYNLELKIAYESSGDQIDLPAIEAEGMMNVNWDIVRHDRDLVTVGGDHYTKLSKDRMPRPLYALPFVFIDVFELAVSIFIISLVVMLLIVMYRSARNFILDYRGMRFRKQPVMSTAMKHALLLGLLVIIIGSLVFPVMSSVRYQSELAGSDEHESIALFDTVKGGSIFDSLFDDYGLEDSEYDDDGEIVDLETHYFKMPSANESLKRKPGERNTELEADLRVARQSEQTLGANGNVYKDEYIITKEDEYREHKARGRQEPISTIELQQDWGDTFNSDDMLQAEQFLAKADKQFRTAQKMQARGRAERRLKSYIKSSPSSPAKKKPGAQAQSKVEMEKALENIEQALILNPENREAVQMFLKSNVAIGNESAQAFTRLKEIKREHAKNKKIEKEARANLKKAKEAEAKGETLKAGAFYSKALELSKGFTVESSSNTAVFGQAQTGLSSVVERSRAQGGRDLKEQIQLNYELGEGMGTVNLGKPEESLTAESFLGKDQDGAAEQTEELLSSWEDSVADAGFKGLEFKFGKMESPFALDMEPVIDAAEPDAFTGTTTPSSDPSYYWNYYAQSAKPVRRAEKETETDAELKMEAMKKLKVLKKDNAALFNADGKGIQAGVKPLVLDIESVEGVVHSFEGKYEGGELYPISFGTVSMSLLVRIALILMALPLAALFFKKTWKHALALASAGIILFAVCIPFSGITEYFISHAAAGAVIAAAAIAVYSFINRLHKPVV